jgi:NTE family protein
MASAPARACREPEGRGYEMSSPPRPPARGHQGSAQDTTSRPHPAAGRHRIALALGGGGARGLAHVLVLEALDELGVRPHVIAGTSIGAIYGAAYASGLSAKLIRAHTEEVLGQRLDLLRQLYAARAVPIQRLLNFIPVRSALLDPVALMDLLLPSKVPRDFAALQIPLHVVATDFYAQEPVVFSQGPLRPVVAASMALPALFSPVVIDGHALVDGGLVNPLPFDIVAALADVTIAVDVSGNAPAAIPLEARPAQPSAIDVLMSSTQIFQRSIVREKLKSHRPDVFIECPVDSFGVVDFHRYREVLAASLPVKDMVKRQLDRILGSQTADALPPPSPTAIEPPRAARPRSLLANLRRRRARKPAEEA